MSLEDVEMRRRLLELFPGNTLDSLFPAISQPNKKARIDAIAESDSVSVDDLCQFVHTFFGRLRQHVHILEHDPRVPSTLERRPEPFGDVMGVFSTDEGQEHHRTYVLPRLYSFFLTEPFEHGAERFPWPIRLVITPAHIRIHFAKMSQNLGARLDRKPYGVSKSPHDRYELIQRARFLLGIPLTAVDLNEGIKAVWRDGIVDAMKAEYKRPRAKSKEVMDEAYTIKQDDPLLFAQLIESLLYNCTFKFMNGHPHLEHFSTDPTRGSFTFHRHTPSNEAVHELIRHVLEQNG